jgi:hypothetical protein
MEKLSRKVRIELRKTEERHRGNSTDISQNPHVMTGKGTPTPGGLAPAR